MNNLYYVCSTLENATLVNAKINENMSHVNGGNWDTPRQRYFDSKWIIAYTDDPSQAWRFVDVTGYESIEQYADNWAYPPEEGEFG